MSGSSKRFDPSRKSEILIPITLVLLTLVLIATLVIIGFSLF